MRTNVLVAVFFCGLASLPLQSIAQKKTAAKKPVAKNMTLVEAYTQSIVPGREGAAPPPVGTFIVVKWETATMPETFFWRGKGGFFPCNIERAHKISAKEAKSMPAGMVYNTESITNDQIKKGDTLMLVPLLRGKFPVPKEISANDSNCLFYRLPANNSWLKLPVPKMTSKKNVSAQ